MAGIGCRGRPGDRGPRASTPRRGQRRHELDQGDPVGPMGGSHGRRLAVDLGEEDVGRAVEDGRSEEVPGGERLQLGERVALDENAFSDREGVRIDDLPTRTPGGSVDARSAEGGAVEGRSVDGRSVEGLAADAPGPGQRTMSGGCPTRTRARAVRSGVGHALISRYGTWAGNSALTSARTSSASDQGRSRTTGLVSAPRSPIQPAAQDCVRRHGRPVARATWTAQEACTSTACRTSVSFAPRSDSQPVVRYSSADGAMDSTIEPLWHWPVPACPRTSSWEPSVTWSCLPSEARPAGDDGPRLTGVGEAGGAGPDEGAGAGLGEPPAAVRLRVVGAVAEAAEVRG